MAPSEGGSSTSSSGGGGTEAEPTGQRGSGASSSGRPSPARPAKAGLLQEFVTSGVSVACATTVTNPFDVIKTRMQLFQSAAGAGGQGSSPGMLATGTGIVRAEGVGALWKGLPPAVLRGLLYGGLRLGLYSPTRDWLEGLAAGRGSGDNRSGSGTGSGGNSESGSKSSGGSGGSSSSSRDGSSGGSSSSRESSIEGSGRSGGGGHASTAGPGVKLAAGTLSGGGAAAVCSPTELLKTRLQAPGAGRAGAWAVAREVVKADGVAGLWKGATPGLVRASILTASQCATYDETKRRVMAATGWGDTAGTHLACSLVTGLASTTATNPVDVVKTHMFVGGGRYSGPLQCAAAVYRAHGPAGFFRGWGANYTRLGPQTAVTFLVAEQLRRLAGLQAL